jgi:hypothetical protein
MRIVHILMLTLTLTLLTGCAATMTALEKRDLRIGTQMSETIFLDIENQGTRSIYVDIRNTSNQILDVAGPVVQALQARGYTVTSDPRSAFCSRGISATSAKPTPRPYARHCTRAMEGQYSEP